jgi:mannose-6-phosphate isomerase-like protein (cupin superfamily)
VEQKINLDDRFSRFRDTWSPKIVGTLNDYDLKVAKVEGEFVWHVHDETDELFLVHKGRLVIQLEGRDDIVLESGELFVVPRGVRHCPVADSPTEILLLEPAGTLNTGDATAGGTIGEPI